MNIPKDATHRDATTGLYLQRNKHREWLYFSPISLKWCREYNYMYTHTINRIARDPSLKGPRILILGMGRHGKDAVAELLHKYWGMEFESSSMACCKIFIYNELKDRFNYGSIEDCYNDRHNHRALWHRMISDYNTPDKIKLAKQILETNDIYVGMRCIHELNQAKQQKLFDRIVWVDASKRLPPEAKESMSITKEDAWSVIDNNGPESDLLKKVADWTHKVLRQG